MTLANCCFQNSLKRYVHTLGFYGNDHIRFVVGSKRFKMVTSVSGSLGAFFDIIFFRPSVLERSGRHGSCGIVIVAVRSHPCAMSIFKSMVFVGPGNHGKFVTFGKSEPRFAIGRFGGHFLWQRRCKMNLNDALKGASLFRCIFFNFRFGE